MKKISSLLIFSTLLFSTTFLFPKNVFALNSIVVKVVPGITSAQFTIDVGSNSGWNYCLSYSIYGDSNNHDVPLGYLDNSAHFVYKLTGLSPTINYAWGISTGSSSCSGGNFASDNFTTNDISATVSSSNISQTGAKFTAVFSPASDFTTPPAIYYIATTTAPSDIDPAGDALSVVTACSGSSNCPLGTIYTATLSSLTASTTYYYRLYSADLSSSTVAKMGGVQTFTTPAVATPGVPSITNITGDGATISITDGVAHEPSPFVVYYGTEDVVDKIVDSSPMSASDKINFSTTLSGLSTSTVYYYFVKNSDGGMYPTSPGNFTTASTTTGGGGGGGGNGKIVDTMKGSNGKVSAFVSSFPGGGLVPCGTASSTGKDKKCTFDHLIKMVNTMISFLLWVIAPAVMSGAIAYGGWEYLSSAGGEAKEKGKKFMMNAFYGWLMAMAAWIIVKFLMQALGYKESVFPTFW